MHSHPAADPLIADPSDSSRPLNRPVLDPSEPLFFFSACSSTSRSQEGYDHSVRHLNKCCSSRMLRRTLGKYCSTVSPYPTLSLAADMWSCQYVCFQMVHGLLSLPPENSGVSLALPSSPILALSCRFFPVTAAIRSIARPRRQQALPALNQPNAQSPSFKLLSRYWNFKVPTRMALRL